jgi:hypothetical protein
VQDVGQTTEEKMISLGYGGWPSMLEIGDAFSRKSAKNTNGTTENQTTNMSKHHFAILAA